MNYTTIKLLFDPRGIINRKEFLLGIIILFLFAQYNTILFLRTFGITALIGQQKTELMVLYQLVKPLSIPMLPANFILFYSSIILAIKRVKDIHWNLYVGIFAGLCIFLFFDGIFLEINTNIALTTNWIGYEVNNSTKTFHLLIITITTVLGLLTLITLLSLNGDKLYEKEKRNMRFLTISQFITQLGILCITAYTLYTLTSILYYFNNNELIKIIYGLISLLILIWYFILVFYRLKNANRAFYPFLLCFIVYVSSLIFVWIIITKLNDFNLINVSLTILSFTTIIFTIANISLFLFEEIIPSSKLSEKEVHQ